MFMMAALNKTYILTILVLLLNLLILSGCNNNSDQRDFERQAFSEPSGITETNQMGQVGNPDPDDWRIAPFFQGDIDFVVLPHPNPIQTNETLIFDLRVNFPDRIGGIYVYIFHHLNNIPEIDSIPQASFGLNSFRINASIIAGGNPNPEGLYRIIIQDDRNDIISYGDIQIK